MSCSKGYESLDKSQSHYLDFLTAMHCGPIFILSTNTWLINVWIKILFYIIPFRGLIEIPWAVPQSVRRTTMCWTISTNLHVRHLAYEVCTTVATAPLRVDLSVSWFMSISCKILTNACHFWLHLNTTR